MTQLPAKLQNSDRASKFAYLDFEREYKAASATHRSVAATCQAARERLKTADFGENQNPEFERAFGSVAFTYLREKVPGLIPYIVGFQLLDRADDGKRAIGVFVAELGSRKIDIPMFFVDGELKGHHIMRLRQPEMFIPLREAFLDYLFSKLPQDIGEEGPSMSTASPVRATPDIQPFSGSRFYKGAEEASWIHEWAELADVGAEYANMRMNPRNLKLGIALKNKQSGMLLDLSKAVSTNMETLKIAANLADNYPLFKEKMARLLGEDWLVKAATEYKGKKEKKDKRDATYRFRVRRKTLKLMPTGNEKKKVSMDLRFIRQLLDATPDSKMAEEIDRFGSFVRDNRPTEKLAAAWDIEESGEVVIAPPDEPCECEVMVDEGIKRKVCIFPSTYRQKGVDTDLIIDKKSGKFCEASRNSYAAFCETKIEDPSRTVEKALGNGKNRPSSGDIIIFYKNKQALGPYLIKERVSKDRFEVSDFTGSFTSYTNEGYPSEYQSISPGRSRPDITKIVYVSSGSGEGILGGHKGTLSVPKGTKCITLAKAPVDSDGYLSYRDEKNLKLEVYDKLNLRTAELTKKANLAIQTHPNRQVTVNGVRMKEAAARAFLLREVCLPKKTAMEMLDMPHITKRYLVQAPGQTITSLAQLDKLSYYTPTIEFPESNSESVSESGNYVIDDAEELYSEADFEPTRNELNPWEEVPDSNPHSIDTQTYGMMEDDEEDVMSDLAGLASLIKNGRLDTTLRRLSKSLLEAIDNLCRTIFVTSAHDEEFAREFSESEKADIEQALINNLEASSDLFLSVVRREGGQSAPELDVDNLSVGLES